VNNLRQERSRRRELYHGVGSYLYIGYAAPQIVRLARQMRASGAHLVHLNRDHGAAGRLVILAAKLAGLPVLCYAQNFSEFFAVDRQIARYVDRYVFCSNAIGQHCLTHGGVQASQSMTIYPGVADAGKWSQPYDTAQVRQSLGWTPADFVVGCIGRLVPWKGQEVFLRALAEVRRHAPAVKGLVVGGESRLATGQSSYFEHLRALAGTLGLTENVNFTGYRTDIPPLMASVDVLVHSSVEPEPFATTVIEGMMAGRAVIATDAGGMPEMIAEGVTGRLVPPRDPQAMAEAILDYHRDPERARRMGLAAQQAALGRLTAERHVAEFQALYDALFARPDAGRRASRR
jgi:glycosyltransferase involved in cell wall biosynthesis